MWRAHHRREWPNRLVRREWVRGYTLATCVLSTRNLPQHRQRPRTQPHTSWLPRQRAAWRHENAR